MSARTRFEKEAKGNSEMTLFSHFFLSWEFLNLRAPHVCTCEFFCDWQIKMFEILCRSLSGSGFFFQTKYLTDFGERRQFMYA